MKKEFLPFWIVDAFASEPFKGNPAAVYILHEEITDELMQDIAIEMNQSETAFLLIRKEQNPLIRWFTSVMEIDLCGHATLASAHIYFSEIDSAANEVIFDTKFVGELRIAKNFNQYSMDFPSRLGSKLSSKDVPEYVLNSLSSNKPIEIYQSRDLMLVYENEDIIKNIKPDFNKLINFESFIIVTSLSSDSNYDFISRFFCANDAVPEDPVTGSAHCTLAPYWSIKLNKVDLKAYQASKRGGELHIKNFSDRVIISGQALSVIEGKLNLKILNNLI
jgi:PhzF family phenazine biosynthesis protein